MRRLLIKNGRAWNKRSIGKLNTFILNFLNFASFKSETTAFIRSRKGQAVPVKCIPKADKSRLAAADKFPA